MSSESTPSDDFKEHNDDLLALDHVDPAAYPFSALPAPSDGSAKCKVALIRTGIVFAVPKPLFIDGAKPGSIFPFPSFSFLIEKEVQGHVVDRVLFELGLRETSKHKGPAHVMLAKNWVARANAGVAEILNVNNIPLDSISGLVIGHVHSDHIGNLADFPNTVSMLVGPESPLGDELAEEMDVPIDIITSRKVRQLNRESDKWQDIGTFRGFDYFGDGSFWVLDVPGHKPGHLACLVRTSVHPPAYYLLGSDTTHSPNILLQTTKPALWPASVLNPAWGSKLMSMHHDLPEAYASIAKMRRMDQEENVQVILAHDMSVDLFLPEGDFVPLAGTLEEVRNLKSRNLPSD